MSQDQFQHSFLIEWFLPFDHANNNRSGMCHCNLLHADPAGLKYSQVCKIDTTHVAAMPVKQGVRAAQRFGHAQSIKSPKCVGPEAYCTALPPWPTLTFDHSHGDAHLHACAISNTIQNTSNEEAHVGVSECKNACEGHLMKDAFIRKPLACVFNIA